MREQRSRITGIRWPCALAIRIAVAGAVAHALASCGAPDGGTAAVDGQGPPSPGTDAGAPPGIVYDRRLALPGIADPDVLKESDDLFLLSGTSSGNALPIYESTDLVTFTHKRDYSPSAADPAFDYCFVWAPDLSRKAGVYHLYFSAVRVAEGAACPSPDGEVTTFRATAPDATLAFGAPQELNPGTSFPRTRITKGCPPDGCERAVRIDAALVHDGATDWLFYTWFENGNNISAFALDAPQTTRRVTMPRLAFEEIINEAPDVFVRDGKYYLFFSHGFFNSQYAMSYFMGDSLADLTRARAMRRHSRPTRNAAGKVVENHGHNAVVERRGQFYNVFHVGEFHPDGTFTGSRSTYVQPIAFRPDGAIHSLDSVDVRWSSVPGAVYSLDVKRRDGTVVGPCIGAGVLGAATGTTFSGICPNAGDARVPKSTIVAFVLYMAKGGGPFLPVAEVPYDGVSDRVFLDIPEGKPAAIAVHWNEKSTGAGYSLDVQRADGTWVAPCVGVDTLGSSIAHVFAGACITAGTTEDLASVKQLRICSAVGGNWGAATCGAVAYDGRRGDVDITVP